MSDNLAAYDTVFSRRIAEGQCRGLKQAILYSYEDCQKTLSVIAVSLGSIRGQFGVILGASGGHPGPSGSIREH